MPSFSTWNTLSLVVDGVEIGICMSIFLALDENHSIVYGKLGIKMTNWNFITHQHRFCNPDAILDSIRKAEEETNQFILVSGFSKNHYIDEVSQIKQIAYKILQYNLRQNQQNIVYV